MSDELKDFERRLERITAPECPAHLLSDPENAALREGWLALGDLLDAAQPMRDAGAVHPELPRRRVGAGWRLVGGAAVAASLLLGTTVAWHRVGGYRRGGSDSRTGGSVVMVERPAIDSGRSRAVPAGDELAWNDPLDDEIVSVAQRIVLVQQEWDYAADVFGAVYYGFEELEDELDESTL